MRMALLMVAMAMVSGGTPSDNDDPALEPVRKAFEYVRLASEQLLVAAMRLEVPPADD